MDSPLEEATYIKVTTSIILRKDNRLDVQVQLRVRYNGHDPGRKIQERMKVASLETMTEQEKDRGLWRVQHDYLVVFVAEENKGNEEGVVKTKEGIEMHCFREEMKNPLRPSPSIT